MNALISTHPIVSVLGFCIGASLVATQTASREHGSAPLLAQHVAVAPESTSAPERPRSIKPGVTILAQVPSSSSPTAGMSGGSPTAGLSGSPTAGLLGGSTTGTLGLAAPGISGDAGLGGDGTIPPPTADQGEDSDSDDSDSRLPLRGSSAIVAGGAAPFFGASTAGEGYARGIAEMTRSAGQANLLNSQAAVTTAEAVEHQIDNRERFVDMYYRVKQLSREYRSMLNGGPTSQEQAVAISDSRKPKLLTDLEMNPYSGEITWPRALQSEVFAPQREVIESVVQVRASLGWLPNHKYVELHNSINSMTDGLVQHVSVMDANTYVAGKRFLESLDYMIQ